MAHRHLVVGDAEQPGAERVVPVAERGQTPEGGDEDGAGRVLGFGVGAEVAVAVGEDPVAVAQVERFEGTGGGLRQAHEGSVGRRVQRLARPVGRPVSVNQHPRVLRPPRDRVTKRDAARGGSLHPGHTARAAGSSRPYAARTSRSLCSSKRSAPKLNLERPLRLALPGLTANMRQACRGEASADSSPCLELSGLTKVLGRGILWPLPGGPRHA